ncbi:thioredoxin O2, mitochondrial [Diospyros lotus]|uniref:thioredoxin O2, mitochondrial n=1 Tax=Diospyros lotus TaxID=55363 RepID=UPI00224FC8C0|nr:thioredoxin O2, mitochondrial [Diospyros lotus]
MKRSIPALRNLIIRSDYKRRVHLPSVDEAVICAASATAAYSSYVSSSRYFFNSSVNIANFELPQPFNLRRNLSSSSSGPSNVVTIDSEEKFNSSFQKVQDEALPAIFYFTAVWCGPCRLLSPIIGQLSAQYPHVTTYKIDIDQEGLGSTLSKLDIHSVPTLHFFKDGKKASEVIGADPQLLKATMEDLYK